MVLKKIDDIFTTIEVSDATPTVLIEIPFSNNAFFKISGSVIGHKSDFTEATTATVEGSYVVDGAGNVVVVYENVIKNTSAGFSTTDVLISNDGEKIIITIVGVAATISDWDASLTLLKTQ